MRRIREIEISDCEPSFDKLWLKLRNGKAELYCHINGEWDKISADGSGGGSLSSEEIEAINSKIDEITSACASVTNTANESKKNASDAVELAGDAKGIAENAESLANNALESANTANQNYNTFANQVSTFESNIQDLANNVTEAKSNASEAKNAVTTLSDSVTTMGNRIDNLQGQIVGLSLTADNVTLSSDDVNLKDTINVLTALEKIAAKVWYAAITIKSTSAEPPTGTYEIGKTLSAPTISWTTSKTPTAITVNGTAIDKSSTSYTLKSQLASTTNVTLKVTDDMGGTASKTFTWTFAYAIYTGMATIPSEYTQEWVKNTFNKTLKTSASGTYTMKASTSDEYWWIVVPSSWSISFSTSLGQIDMDKPATISEFVNDEGKTVSMKIYKAKQVQGSDTSITVK